MRLKACLDLKCFMDDKRYLLGSFKLILSKSKAKLRSRDGRFIAQLICFLEESNLGFKVRVYVLEV